MPLTVVYVTHSTSTDNEKQIASGHRDPDLSPLGERQAAELGERMAAVKIAAVYCLDLRRGYRTAEIAFAKRAVSIHRDARCREINYGEMNGEPLSSIDAVRAQHVHTAFPRGQSYKETTAQLETLLRDAHRQYGDGTVVVVGSRATYIALQHLCCGVPLAEAVLDPRPWREEWRYEFEPR